MRRQLDLFVADETQSDEIGPAPAPASVFGIAERLSPRLRLGTSSWSFPGWAGIVYDRAASQAKLAREGLAAYAQHPLLRAVSVDRSYYGPLDAAHFAAWADDVPETFRFAVKVDRACTTPDLREGTGPGMLPNPLFLDPDHALRSTIRPALDGLGDRAGVFILQFPPVQPRLVGGPRTFAERLGRFLDDLPADVPIAVELRTPELFTPRYADSLARTRAVHCYTVHPRMRSLADQLNAIPVAANRVLVVRWMLHAGLGYEEAREQYRPFDRIIDEDRATREITARACLDAERLDRDAYVLINNKAEGSAPLSVLHLAEHIVGLAS